MLCRFTLASGSKSLVDVCGKAPGLPYPIYLSDGSSYPVLRNVSGRIQWSFMDIDDNHPMARTQELFSDQVLRKNYHDYPVIIPSNCIYVESGDKVKLIRSMTKRVMLFAGVSVGKQLKNQFRLITCESPDILSEHTARIPVLIDPEEVIPYLQEPDLESISKMADSSGSDWFDLFDVSPQVATSTVNSKRLITPLNKTDRSKMDKLEKEILDFRKRANRRSGK